MQKKSLLSLLLTIVVCTISIAQGPWQRGSHSFEYTGYEPLADKPIIVRYYIPMRGNITNMRVLFSMHGADRNAASGVETWRHFAEADGFIVIAPEYIHANGWLENDYQFGGLFTDRTFAELNPQEKWTYNTIEAIFDDFKRHTGNVAEQYDIHGHSAGGQFVNRMVLTMPNARIRLAVASNPSTWTYPLIDGLKDREGNVFGWPYSVKGTPFANREDVKRYLAAPLIIHLGNADILADDQLARSPGAMAQGPNRFDRGNTFFRASRRVARDMRAPFEWRRVEVQDVGHAGRSIVYGKRRRVDGQNVFDIEHISRTGAYFLIFGR
jgi:hypothetical protein